MAPAVVTITAMNKPTTTTANAKTAKPIFMFSTISLCAMAASLSF
jgi:hypothetical protein